jgi:hypothetical protein
MILLLLLRILLCQRVAAALDVLKDVVVEVELVNEVAVIAFKDLDTLVFKANETKMDSLEVEHQQVIYQIGHRGDLGLALVAALPCHRDCFKCLLGDQFGLLLVGEPLGRMEVHLVLRQNVSEHTFSLDCLQEVGELDLARHQHQVLLLADIPLLLFEGTELLLLLRSIELGVEVFLTEIDIVRALVQVSQYVPPDRRLQLQVA